MLELLVVVAIIIVIGATAYPSLSTYLRNYRIAGDAKRIASQIALARMRSAGDYNREQVAIDPTTNTFRINACEKTSGTWLNETGANLPLSSGVTFGYGSITVPAGGQTTIAQTSAITFNSRGIPITLTGNCKSSSTPIGTDAVYLSGGGLYYAITVNLTGKVDVWRYTGSAWQATGY